MKFKFLKIIFTSFLLALSSSANAGLIFNIERISDTEGLLTASGAIDIDVSNTVDGMGFTLFPSNYNSAITVISQNLMLGGDAFRAIRFRNPSQLLLRMQSSYERGDVFSGQLRFSLTEGVMFEVGSSTRLFNNNLPGEVYGSVEYVASSVPEPSTLAIFALGIIGLASRRFNKSY
jgi:hypothetical protein